MTTEDYKRGYEKGFATALKYHGKEIVDGRIQHIEDEESTTGLSKGQVAVIKMSFTRFGASPNQMAKHYNKPLRIMRRIQEGKLFANVRPRGEA